MRKFPIGTRVRVIEGAGLSSNLQGVVIPPELDRRGIAKEEGAYRPFDPRTERMIRADDGRKFTMFTSYLRVDSARRFSGLLS